MVFIILCHTEFTHETSCVFPTALKDSSKRSINSDWKIELPGEFELAGTTVRYVRRGLWEKMSAKGPTKTPLHLMVNTSGTLFCVVMSQYTLDIVAGLKRPAGHANAYVTVYLCVMFFMYMRVINLTILTFKNYKFDMH